MEVRLCVEPSARSFVMEMGRQTRKIEKKSDEATTKRFPRQRMESQKVGVAPLD